ncbi:MAG: hypothetical protein CFE23_14895 [Flavobacterium sp. BFFFF1]|uniref:GLPGLI family protein n=1 Tax=Flavobacterium sp. BFFFF1 TaxID=2015557 RepID=UPI000BD231E6|nr:GLPGLI family protein [Flavobacterium sp. BFFFF1]OYU79272.1 MAG: hypothetical protein CFE23_14895 [Flavobacterium sp. BFFFF1]
MNLKMLVIGILALIGGRLPHDNQRVGIALGHVVYKIGKYDAGTQSNAPVSADDIVSFKKIDEEMGSLAFDLFFGEHESLYALSENAAKDNGAEFEITFARLMAGGLCYKNNLTKEKMEQIPSFGQVFNVIKPYDEYKWEISNETKVINGFTCYKATGVKEDHDDVRHITRTFYPVAWFTPDIPFSFGPKGLDGLPGLVLEATFNGKLYYYAVTIDLGFNEKYVIQKPFQERYVSEKEFYKIDAENFLRNTD